MSTRDIRPGDEIMVRRAPDYTIPIDVPTGLAPVKVIIGLVGTALLPSDDGRGWVVYFSPFGEAVVPNRLLVGEAA